MTASRFSVVSVYRESREDKNVKWIGVKVSLCWSSMPHTDAGLLRRRFECPKDEGWSVSFGSDTGNQIYRWEDWLSYSIDFQSVCQTFGACSLRSGKCPMNIDVLQCLWRERTPVQRWMQRNILSRDCPSEHQRSTEVLHYQTASPQDQLLSVSVERNKNDEMKECPELVSLLFSYLIDLQSFSKIPPSFIATIFGRKSQCCQCLWRVIIIINEHIRIAFSLDCSSRHQQETERRCRQYHSLEVSMSSVSIHRKNDHLTTGHEDSCLTRLIINASARCWTPSLPISLEFISSVVSVYRVSMFSLDSLIRREQILHDWSSMPRLETRRLFDWSCSVWAPRFPGSVKYQ